MLCEDAQQLAGAPHNRSGGRVGHRWALLAGLVDAQAIGRGRDLDVSLFDVALLNACPVFLANARLVIQPDARKPRVMEALCSRLQP